MDLLPKQDFFSWYLNLQIPLFLKHRIQSLGTSFRYFNITGLLKTLFAPYRRIYVAKNKQEYYVSGLLDRITFNLISRFIGAFVRLFLIVVGAIGLIFIFLANFIYTVTWILIPLFSIPAYLHTQNNTFFENDLQDSSRFAQKLAGTSVFKLLTLFFEEDLKSLFQNVPELSFFNVKPPQKPDAIILTIAKNWQPLKSYLDQKNIKKSQFETLVKVLTNYSEFRKRQTLTQIGQILSFGYTKNLDQFATTITGSNFFLTETEKQTLAQIEKIITRNQNNNVLLVGEPGVGRHAIIKNLASEIESGQIPGFSAKQPLYIDMISISGTGKNLVEVKSNFESVLFEAKNAGNIILIIDQIDRILSPKDEHIDLSDVLINSLREPLLPIIGITTPDDFSAYIRPNPNILKLFEKIDLEEASQDNTLEILIGKALNLWQKEKVNIHLDAIAEIVQRSTQLIQDRKQPEKAIILLDEVKAEAQNRHQPVSVDLVDKLISQKAKTPIGKLTKSESAKLRDLESILHQRIVGQNEAVTEIARAMRRARAEIETGTRPIGSFLFLGPTGVGKTETAKALAQVYFGADDRMVRFDMSEYQENDALARLIGNASNKSPGLLATQIRDHPFGLLLIDEFEKATPSVQNLFLQILDEGFLTDAFGKKVNFDNTIIIATSNAGAEFIREEVEKGSIDLSKKLVNYVLQKNLFSPELVNRFDAVVVYHPLIDDQVVQVAKLMLETLAKKLKESKNITLEITPELTTIVAKAGYDPQFGARPIRRLIADKIEDGIAKMIIEGNIKNGDKIPASTLFRFLAYLK